MPMKTDDLHPDRALRVEAGLAEFQRIAQERDNLQRDLNALNEKYKLAELEIDRLNTEASDRRALQETAEANARKATAERIAYETIFRLMFDVLRKFVPPAVPERVSPEERMGAPEVGAAAVADAMPPSPPVPEFIQYTRQDCGLMKCVSPPTCKLLDRCQHPRTGEREDGNV